MQHVTVSESRHIAEALRAVERARAAGAQSVIVLCDIDNTVLRMAGPAQLGSDQWFRWQMELMRAGEPRFPDGPRVARDMRELQKVAADIYDTEPAEPCEGTETVRVLNALRNAADVELIFLTARAECMRGITREQLDNVLKGFPSAEHMMLMCSGAPKARVAAPHVGDFDAVVFVDDSHHHVADMARAASEPRGVLAAAGPYRLEAVWYKHEDARVRAFETVDKTAVRRAYAEWRARTTKRRGSIACRRSK